MLPDDEYQTVRESLELVPTPVHFKFFERNQPIRHVYFPCSGEHSVVSIAENGMAAEVGTIGYEGFSPVDLLMEADTASETTVCQIAGESLRMGAAQFKALLRDCPVLRHIALRFLQAYIGMVSQSVACNALHTIEQRFARWMLMSNDRVHSNEFALTHEYIAMMLGTHRPSVTRVATTFQRDGILQYRRGVITVLDRAALENASCECYALVREQFKRFLGKYPTGPLDDGSGRA